ncbi:MAG: 30S ribosomal protein S12 methylthiotransferase RimO [Bacilli bacterium]|nr:30S ribosomal protein S12 methylthiotransferase RimO [Bacilli bacterium]
MNLGIISLGCAKNLVDTEMFLGLAKEFNLNIVNNFKQADILVVNTCGFIESAKQEAIDTILELVEYKKQGKIIIAMGCLVERYLNDLKQEIPEVDYYIPIKDYPKLNKIFEEITNKQSNTTFDCAPRVISTSPNYAYLRISEGCNNRCTYCAIPLIRGSFRSRPFDDIIMEAKYLSSKGITELNVISQDTSRYGTDINNSLANLLDTLANLNKFKLIRVLYLYPDEITDELLEVMKKHDSIVKYFDIPIQHASDKVLQAMNRRGNQELITNVIKKIRHMMPDAIVRTTLIVGFPGETDNDFQILKDFVKETKFDRLGVFKYSDEEDTVAYEMDNKIDDETKDVRFNEIMEIQYYVTQELNNKLIGKTFEVLVDHYDNKKRAYACRSYREAPDDVDGYIYLKEDVTIGQYYNVEIINIKDYDLIGKLK